MVSYDYLVRSSVAAVKPITPVAPAKTPVAEISETDLDDEIEKALTEDLTK